MTYETPGIVISGVPYAVTEVEGRTPTRLEEFIGETTFVAEHKGSPYVVAGVGSLHDDAVRFHEKVHHGHGKDVRVWHISRGADGFQAEAS